MAVGHSPPRAPFACDPDRSRGRVHAEPPSQNRSDFRRDCDRVIHSTAFRRLKHKTQVFVYHEGDHYRTRLTHSLEVAQIARAIARQLGLDEDLTETLALAHDLGHPPFGHAGERALDRCLAAHGGFDHNAQALRVVTSLERRYPAFDGLNLTWETLEGVVKHNGPLTDRNGNAVGRHAEHGVPHAIAAYVRGHDLDLWSFASLEAQVAALADDIAYDAHDIDDGLRAGLFRVEELSELPLAGDLVRDIGMRYPSLDAPRRGAELVRELISRLIGDLVMQTRAAIAAAHPSSVDDVRRLDRALVGFSPAIAAADRAIKEFLFARMYRHARVVEIMRQAETVVGDLYERYARDPGQLSPGWSAEQGGGGETDPARRIGDFIAGMTDRFALIEHGRLFDLTPELR